MLNIKSDVTGNKTGGRSEVNKKPVYGQQLSVQDLFDGAKQHTHVDQRPVFSYGKGGIRTRMYQAVKLKAYDLVGTVADMAEDMFFRPSWRGTCPDEHVHVFYSEPERGTLDSCLEIPRAVTRTRTCQWLPETH